MGGMSLMALARRHSCTCSDPTASCPGGARGHRATRYHRSRPRPGLRNPVVDAFRASVRRAPRLVQAGRGITRSSLEPVLVAASFGPGFHSRAAGRAVEKIIQNTPLETLVNFLYALEDHDESTAFPVLAQVPSVVVGGSADQLTPLPTWCACTPTSDPSRGWWWRRTPGIWCRWNVLNWSPRRSSTSSSGAGWRCRRPGGAAGCEARSDRARHPMAQQDLPDVADTESLGRELSSGLAAGDVVILDGPLGAGKTALARGIGAGLVCSGACRRRHSSSPANTGRVARGGRGWCTWTRTGSVVWMNSTPSTSTPT